MQKFEKRHWDTDSAREKQRRVGDVAPNCRFAGAPRKNFCFFSGRAGVVEEKKVCGFTRMVPVFPAAALTAGFDSGRLC